MGWLLPWQQLQRTQSNLTCCVCGRQHTCKPNKTSAQAARESTQRYKDGHPLSVLDGIPTAIKDELAVESFTVSCGRAQQGRVRSTDSDIVRTLRNRGAIILGRYIVQNTANESTIYSRLANFFVCSNITLSAHRIN